MLQTELIIIQSIYMITIKYINLQCQFQQEQFIAAELRHLVDRQTDQRTSLSAIATASSSPSPSFSPFSIAYSPRLYRTWFGLGYPEFSLASRPETSDHPLSFTWRDSLGRRMLFFLLELNSKSLEARCWS